MKTQIHLKSQWFWFVMTSLTHSVAQFSIWRSGPICCLFLHIASHRSSNSNQYTVNAKVLMALFVSLVLEVWEGRSDLLLFSPRESITFKFVNVFSPRKRTSHICTRWLTMWWLTSMKQTDNNCVICECMNVPVLGLSAAVVGVETKQQWGQDTTLWGACGGQTLFTLNGHRVSRSVKCSSSRSVNQKTFDYNLV